MRVDAVMQAAKLMAASAITAPKSGGQLFLAGKHNFMETVVVFDSDERRRIAESSPNHEKRDVGQVAEVRRSSL